ncbi:MAG: nitroreductase family protein [Streptosporangiales bacterium]|nr:nitroreductase family protein [Streptosporangiales bacterium]MBO0890700.1 nitroreductase family protein [Acidothermales bacterium]
MEFDDVVTRRRMVRRYSHRSVPAETVTRVLRNAARTPSAGDSQGYAFLLLDTDEQRGRFWAALADTMPVVESVRDAPVLVVPMSSEHVYLDRYAEPDKGWTDRDPARWPVPFWHIDTGMAALLMLLTAVDEGLGALFFGIPAPALEGFRAAFDVPDGYTPVGAVALGYPEPGAGPSKPSKARRPWRDLVHHGAWGTPL